MMNNMPPYGMFPPMDPQQGFGQSQGYPQGTNSHLNERLNNLENQVNRIERQLRRIEARLNRIESSMINPLSSQDTGFGSNNNKYMM